VTRPSDRVSLTSRSSPGNGIRSAIVRLVLTTFANYTKRRRKNKENRAALKNSARVKTHKTEGVTQLPGELYKPLLLY
jgi:hypothetical protein